MPIKLHLSRRCVEHSNLISNVIEMLITALALTPTRNRTGSTVLRKTASPCCHAKIPSIEHLFIRDSERSRAVEKISGVDFPPFKALRSEMSY